SLVDSKYEHFDEAEFNDTITLEQFAENYRLFAASQMHLFYTPEIVRRFVAGMAASKLLILEGISGTGKTSLPYSFSRYLGYPATLVSVQPSYRDKTELLGYFNEFSKRFNETEFLRALYEAGYREEPAMIVLDEMNLARIEYYFAEMLSVLEMPDQSEWVVDLVPTAWPGDPVRLNSGKITVSPNTWFIGTANNDDSTFTITDKVYDRAMPIELNERAAAFECELQPRCPVTYAHLLDLFMKAKEEHPISESSMTKLIKLDQYLQTRFRLAFGNRIMKQMYDFIPVYVACGGKELDGLDYIIARKVLKKFESTNIAFVRDEIKGLIGYIEKTFGETNMNDSRAYLTRIQNLY
ncbi:MAG: AAA family ATPase, partial [Firmicutes bacterium]|nr:AAA family ATPase [Bacillota bacterium]